MADELVDVFDENYAIQGQCMKSVAHKYGLWVHSFHCWIINLEGEGSVYVQRRAPHKKLFPDTLDITAAGHLQAGETIEEGIREIKEELNLDVKYSDLIYTGIKHDAAKLNDIVNRQFSHVFLYQTKTPVTSIIPDGDEVYGLIEIPLKSGLDLFSKKISSVNCQGIEYNTKTSSWDTCNFDVTLNHFIPRVDNYYYKIFIMADLLKSGYQHLSI
ncbi:MAG: NUDIX hydrolase [Desulfovibrio sp.]